MHKIEQEKEEHLHQFASLFNSEKVNHVFIVPTQDRPQGLQALLESIHTELDSFHYNKHPHSGKIKILVVDDSNNFDDNNHIKNQDIVNRFKARLHLLSNNYDVVYWGPYEQEQQQNTIQKNVFADSFDVNNFLYTDTESEKEKSYGRIRNICIDIVRKEAADLDGDTYITWLDDDNMIGAAVIDEDQGIKHKHVFNYLRKIKETF